jgi:hypothetical protein
MSKKRKKITQKTLDNLFEKFDELPEKTPNVLTTRELINRSLGRIEQLLEKGYSAADVVGILTSADVQITLGTFRRYLREAKGNGNPTRASKAKAEIQSDIRAEAQPEAKPEVKTVANTEQQPRYSGKFLEMSDDL